MRGMTYPHVMLDIETLGTAPGCVVLSIGAVPFDLAEPDEGYVCDALYMEIMQHSCRAVGLYSDEATNQWWLAQGPQARGLLLRTGGGHIGTWYTVPLADALERLANWLRKIGNPHVDGGTQIWARGASFDFPILAAAYRAVGQPLPWHYRNERCMRTLLALPGMSRAAAKAPQPVIAHHALEDARAQALAVCHMLLDCDRP